MRDAKENIIQRLRTLYGRYNHPADQKRIDKLLLNPAVVEELHRSCRDYRDILTTFMTIQMRSQAKSLWGNNVPKDIFNIDKILAFYPTAKILVCIRDPRDFLASYKRFWHGGSSEQHRTRKKLLYHPVLTSLLWRASVKQIEVARALVPGQNLLVIKYESLVARPIEVARQVCETLEVDFENRMLDLDWHNSSFKVDEPGIFSSSVGRWRSQLDALEVHVVQTITAQELRKFGYTPEKLAISKYKLLYVLATLPYALARALYANRSHHGPIIPYMANRISALFS
jgi:hypothetical protein